MSAAKVAAQADNPSLLSVREYEQHAHRILTGFEGVTSHDETRAVLGMRLRAAVETFIKKQGGSAWADLIALMCAYQKLPEREHAERMAATAAASPSVSRPGAR